MCGQNRVAFLGGTAERDFAYCDICYRIVVCPSVCVCVRVSCVTLVHPAKAVGIKCHLAWTLVRIC